jgi:hypothetical protein
VKDGSKPALIGQFLVHGRDAACFTVHLPLTRTFPKAKVGAKTFKFTYSIGPAHLPPGFHAGLLARPLTRGPPGRKFTSPIIHPLTRTVQN